MKISGRREEREGVNKQRDCHAVQQDLQHVPAKRNLEHAKKLLLSG
jgi:hypothetical protein